MPDKRGERSVFRHGQQPRDRLWAIATENLNLEPGKEVYGAAILTVRDVRAEKLEVIPEEPPPRHANIIGWPSDSDPVEEKAKRLKFAQALVQRADLVMKNQS